MVAATTKATQMDAATTAITHSVVLCQIRDAINAPTIQITLVNGTVFWCITPLFSIRETTWLLTHKQKELIQLPQAGCYRLFRF